LFRAVAERADHTALEILGVLSLRPQGWCRGLKVVPSCYYWSTSHSLVQTLQLLDLSLSHNAQRHRQTDRQTDVLSCVIFKVDFLTICWSTKILVMCCNV